VLTEFWLYKDDLTGDIMALFNLYDINTEYLSKIELMHKAEFDVLTGVYNRVSAEQKIKAYLKNKENAGLDVAFMICDIDGLIKINEKFGHFAGDKALCDVANLASKIFAGNSAVARVGGDEFGVFVWNIKDKREVCDCAAKFVSDVSKLGVGKDATNCVTISLGLCFSKIEIEDCRYSVLYEQADEALMVAKRTGRNKYYQFGSTDCDDGIDKITGKLDYKSFKIKAKRLIEANPTANIVVLFSDIDNFKMINHIYGFAKGDELLRKYSDYLKAKASIDFARTNVDKFVGICLESTAEYEKIFYNMQYNDNLTSLLDLDYPVKRTLGAYKTNGDNFSKSIEEMIELAALASKELQTTSKRDWTVYDDGYIEKRAEENKYEASMEDALKNGEFLMYLQPQLSITENKATGCEALVRWQISEDEIVQPAGFIDLFEKNGFIRELDKYMFNSACQRIRKWIDSGKKPFSIAINVSQKDILSRTFISDYVEMKEKYNVPDGLLEVEFSESIIVENENLMINILEEFKKHGIRTAIDDFGAGCTSLNILNYACVDTLKIDKGFFVECHQCERKKLVVESIVKMAKVLGMSVVAEGIEKEKQIEFLRSIDCEYLQGYVIDKPLPVSEFENKYLQL
ncbi:MAG: EAL domain-containing protein, partial [Clostridia bacterium]